MNTIEQAILSYRGAAETLLLRASMLEEAAPSVDAATAALHAQDATMALLAEQWAVEEFVATGAGVRSGVVDLAAVLSGEGR